MPLRNSTIHSLLVYIFLLEGLMLTFSIPQPAPPSAARDSSSTNMDYRLFEFFTIHSSCKSRRAMVARIISDAFMLAEVGRDIPESSISYKNYFVDPALDQNEFYIVRNMSVSILSNGDSKKKTTIRCPRKDIGVIARTTADPTDDPFIELFPKFFQYPSLASKPFTKNGWCTPPPHDLFNFQVKESFLIHEFTHLAHIAQRALELASNQAAERIIALRRVGTIDITHAKGYDHYDIPAQAARDLKKQWVAYLTSQAHEVKPSFWPDENGESYGDALLG
ncbi:hypothetical protein F5050DRAFT_1843930 [Lentinula boryana]|uniref:Lysine-specific metallo-endopeptidase domain-containing protein n=1 Tax=Lentinula boryana TaxID=40481 RepID=A0ABQ8Q5A5_9AGAR|nr:hypothetical protein F5050DRAFT_1843930 [Lentinula boryana]